MYLEMSSAKIRPFGLGLNVLINHKIAVDSTMKNKSVNGEASVWYIQNWVLNKNIRHFVDGILKKYFIQLSLLDTILDYFIINSSPQCRI